MSGQCVREVCGLAERTVTQLLWGQQGVVGEPMCVTELRWGQGPPAVEKRLRTRPGRVRFFKFYRVGRVRDASAAVSPRGNGNGRGPDAGHTIEFKETDADRTRASRFSQTALCGCLQVCL
eukprot:gene8127-biopygen22595